MFRLKRAYEPAAGDDGERLLVDRLWPRGLSRERAALDGWLKDLAPSDPLRRWFAHDPARWEEFRRRYRDELRAHDDTLRQLARRGRRKRVTLVFGARDADHNNAVVLGEVLQEMAKAPAVH